MHPRRSAPRRAALQVKADFAAASDRLQAMEIQLMNSMTETKGLRAEGEALTAQCARLQQGLDAAAPGRSASVDCVRYVCYYLFPAPQKNRELYTYAIDAYGRIKKI